MPINCGYRLSRPYGPWAEKRRGATSHQPSSHLSTEPENPNLETSASTATPKEAVARKYKTTEENGGALLGNGEEDLATPPNSGEGENSSPELEGCSHGMTEMISLEEHYETVDKLKLELLEANRRTDRAIRERNFLIRFAREQKDILTLFLDNISKEIHTPEKTDRESRQRERNHHRTAFLRDQFLGMSLRMVPNLYDAIWAGYRGVRLIMRNRGSFGMDIPKDALEVETDANKFVDKRFRILEDGRLVFKGQVEKDGFFVFADQVEEDELPN